MKKFNIITVLLLLVSVMFFVGCPDVDVIGTEVKKEVEADASTGNTFKADTGAANVYMMLYDEESNRKTYPQDITALQAAATTTTASLVVENEITKIKFTSSTGSTGKRVTYIFDKEDLIIGTGHALNFKAVAANDGCNVTVLFYDTKVNEGTTEFDSAYAGFSNGTDPLSLINYAGKKLRGFEFFMGAGTDGYLYDVSLTNDAVYTAVTLGSNSLGTAGDGKITGLTAGSKYKITTSEGTFAVNADGTVSASAAVDFADITALTGTEITGLTNGMTYTVKEVVAVVESLTVTVDSIAFNGTPVTIASGFDSSNDYVVGEGTIKFEPYNPWNASMQFFTVPTTSATSSIVLTATISNADLVNPLYFWMNIWIDGVANWIKVDTKAVSANGTYTFTYTPETALTLAASSFYVGLEASSTQPATE